jgi:hypothetical protein
LAIFGRDPPRLIFREQLGGGSSLSDLPRRQVLRWRDISCDDGDRAAKLIQNALGIESDDVVNYCFPKDWPEDRDVRARIIGG